MALYYQHTQGCYSDPDAQHRFTLGPNEEEPSRCWRCGKTAWQADRRFEGYSDVEIAAMDDPMERDGPHTAAQAMGWEEG